MITVSYSVYLNYLDFVLYFIYFYEGLNFNSGNYLFTTDTK